MQTSTGQAQALRILWGLAIVDATRVSLGLAWECAIWPWMHLAMHTGPLTYAVRLDLMRALEVLDRPTQLLPVLKAARRKWRSAIGQTRMNEEEVDGVFTDAVDVLEDSEKAFRWMCRDHIGLPYGVAPFDEVSTFDGRERVVHLLRKIDHGVLL